jgi:hypothetical protein
VNLRKFLEEHLRGWLPKEPNVPEHRLRSMRKPIAIFITATLLITSISIFASYSIFSQPPALPQPAVPNPTTTPTPSPSQPSTPSNATPPAPTSSSTSPSNSTPAPTPPPGYWILTVNESQTFPVLEQNGGWRNMAPIYFYPSANSSFLVVKFNLTPVNAPSSFDVKDVLFVVDDAVQYSPCGYFFGFLGMGYLSNGPEISYPGYLVGNFTGTITNTVAYLDIKYSSGWVPSRPYPLTWPFIFVYDIPRECFDGTHVFQLKIAGSSAGQNFTVPPLSPPP